MSQIEIRPVSGKAEMKTFIRLPGQILKDDPNWVEPLHFERSEFFSRKKNPWFTHGKAEYFLAWKGGRPVGRISAQIDSLSPPVEAGVCGLFGALAAEEDQEIVSALLAQAEDWLRQNGAHHIRGPYTLNINHETGLLIDGFDSPPYLLMPHDPPWLGPMVEAYGLVKGRDAYAYRLDTRGGLPKKLERFYKNAPERMKLRGVDMKRWDEEINNIVRIFNISWADNWGFIPLTQEEIDSMAKEMKPLIDPGLCRVAEVDGEMIGFIILLPNVNEIIADFKGRLFPFNVIRLLWRLKFGRVKSGRVPLMGVLPGLDKDITAAAPLALIYSPRERHMERQMEALEFSWILEDNRPVQRLIEMIGGKIEKTYRIYERPLPPA